MGNQNYYNKKRKKRTKYKKRYTKQSTMTKKIDPNYLFGSRVWESKIFIFLDKKECHLMSFVCKKWHKWYYLHKHPAIKFKKKSEQSLWFNWYKKHFYFLILDINENVPKNFEKIIREFSNLKTLYLNYKSSGKAENKHKYKNIFLDFSFNPLLRDIRISNNSWRNIHLSFSTDFIKNGGRFYYISRSENDDIINVTDKLHTEEIVTSTRRCNAPHIIYSNKKLDMTSFYFHKDGRRLDGESAEGAREKLNWTYWSWRSHYQQNTEHREFISIKNLTLCYKHLDCQRSGHDFYFSDCLSLKTAVTNQKGGYFITK